MALLAASQWLHAPRVEYLIPFVVATGAAVVLAIGTHGDARRWTRACALLLAVSAMLATPAQVNLWRVRHEWDAWRVNASKHGLAALQRALDEATSRGVAITRRALDVSADRTEAFDQLSPLADTPDETGVVLLQRDRPFAWAGQVRPPIDWSRQGITVVATPFYLAIQVIEQRGDRIAAHVALLDAAPPADNLAAPLARRVATDAGLTNGFHFAPASDSTDSDELLRYSVAGSRLFDVRVRPLVQGAVATRITERVGARAGLAFVLALACFVIGVWRGTPSLSQRVAALATGLACTALVPLNQYSNLTRLFDPSVYYTSRGSTLTGNAGALATTGAITLLGILAVFRRQSHRTLRWTGGATVLLVAGLGPFLLRDLARGVQVPQQGVDSTLWLIWEIPLFLAAVSVLLTGAAAGAAVLGPRRGLPPWVAPLAATIAAILAPVVWEAPGRWPWWYTFLWVGAIGMLAFSRRSRSVIISASTVAALGATTLVWGRTARGRVDAAVRDLASLSQADMEVTRILRRFGASLAEEDFAPESRQALLQHYVSSPIAPAGNPVALSAWPTDSAAIASFETARFPIDSAEVARIVHQARVTNTLSIEPVATNSALEIVMAVPSSDGGVTAVVMAPKSRLFETNSFARLFGLDVDPDAEPPYTVRLRARTASDSVFAQPTWRRDGSELHGDWLVNTGKGEAEAHVEVELRTLDALIQRGALIVLLNLTIVAMLWFAGVVADGGAGRWIRARRRTWGRSYRAKLSVALFAFFVMPAIAFAIWAYGQLSTDAITSRAVLVRETLRAVDTPPAAPLWLPAESQRLESPLFMYDGGELREASDPLYEDIAPIGRFLDRDAELALARGEGTQARLEDVGASPMLFGYRSFADVRRPSIVIGAPARADELELGRRRRDLGVLVAFATALGAIAALWLSGIAARQLSRPIGTLREAALSIAAGARMPAVGSDPTDEFRPVFTAFRRMDADLNASRTELEEAQRRTSAVLRNVASGVVAVDADAKVSLANPRAETLLEGALVPGVAFGAQAPAEIARIVERFLSSTSDEQDFEVALDQQQLRGTLTRLARGGAVVTLDDVTELARAQRVLAWGEMARQVAHEIKNPLTPIRLGVQHLRRARADARVDFDRVLEHNVKQILGEIDRLDEIARAFSRYGAAPEERRRAAAIDVAAVVREVVSLERMGEETHLMWEEHGVDVPVRALATSDELKEVLLNILENARHAAAKHVVVSVALDGGSLPEEKRVVISVVDDGRGISPDVLPRVFEPHFSTSTSGSGLGLAISRRLVEGWGGEITLASTQGEGTEVQIRLRPTPTPMA